MTDTCAEEMGPPKPANLALEKRGATTFLGRFWGELTVLVLAIMLWLPRLTGPIDLRWDGGVYCLLGTSLAEGHGYRIPSEPGSPEALQYPPLLPVVVALHQWALGTTNPDVVAPWLRKSYAGLFVVYALAILIDGDALVSVPHHRQVVPLALLPALKDRLELDRRSGQNLCEQGDAVELLALLRCSHRAGAKLLKTTVHPVFALRHTHLLIERRARAGDVGRLAWLFSEHGFSKRLFGGAGGWGLRAVRWLWCRLSPGRRMSRGYAQATNTRTRHTNTNEHLTNITT